MLFILIVYDLTVVIDEVACQYVVSKALIYFALPLLVPRNVSLFYAARDTDRFA